MRNIIIIGAVASLCLITWALILVAFVMLMRRSRYIESDITYLIRKTKNSDESQIIKVLSTQMNELKREYGARTELLDNKIALLINKITETTSSTPFQADGVIVNANDAPAKNKTEAHNQKIWVKRTKEGMKLLESTDEHKEMYLIKKNSHYLLHLAEMNPASLIDMRNLYGDVMEFPVNVSSISEIIMATHPVYEKSGDGYQFQKYGEIKVR